MKVYVFIIFMVIQIILCDKATSKLRRKLIVPKINEECKKIKCAPTEEPECVKLWRPDLGQAFYINVVNKCELEYMKCHDGVEAKIVPMKFCGHGNGMAKAKNKQNKTSEAHIRVKRSAAKGAAGAAAENEGNDNKTVLPISKNPHEEKNEELNFISHPTRMNIKDKKQARLNNKLRYPYSSGEGSDIEINERKKIEKGIAGYRIIIETDNEVPLKVSASPALKGKRITPPGGLEKMKAYQSSEDNSFPFISLETKNNKKGGLDEADKKEYDEICPSVCASRDVMVCARCQHGIYKTFVSICHMRIFACNHNDEVLELISRHPCILSAPYLSEQDMIPKGRIVEDPDDDKVLRFIICRDKTKLGLGGESGDPRCVFEKKSILRGIGIRLPTSCDEKSSSNTLGSSDSSRTSTSSNSSSAMISTSYSLTSTGFSSSGVSDSSSSSC